MHTIHTATRTTGHHKKPEIQEWENEGGATRRPPPEPDSLQQRIEGRVRSLPQRFESAVRQQPLLALVAALGVGLFIGSRLRGPAAAALRFAGKPIAIVAAKLLWNRVFAK